MGDDAALGLQHVARRGDLAWVYSHFANESNCLMFVPYGNSTTTVKNRNAELPPSGTSLHPSDNSAFPFTFNLGTNELPVPSVEWLNSNIGLPHSFRHSINPSPFFCYPYFIGSLSISDKRSKEIHYLSYSHIERLRQIQA